MMFTTKEISDMLRVSEETVRRWIRNGDLKATQEGKSYFVKGDDLLEAIKKKAEDSTTSIGKIVNAQINGFAKAISSSKGELSDALRKIKEETTKHFKEQTGHSESFKTSIINLKEDMLNKMTGTIDHEEPEVSSDGTFSRADIDSYIEDLQLKRRRVELDYQTKLLEIDEQITKYRKLKETISKVDLEKKETTEE